MHKHFLKFLSLVMVVSISISLSGCTLIFQKGRRSDVEKISQLKSQLTDLERAKQELESRLSSEIDD
ncbi:MAG: hypothetical protein KAR31_08970, partial [Candidatus Omnitrophica bacterium]|nr:hypothetical protein [Candidatus Omnitrophota bacterium]